MGRKDGSDVNDADDVDDVDNIDDMDDIDDDDDLSQLGNLGKRILSDAERKHVTRSFRDEREDGRNSQKDKRKRVRESYSRDSGER